VGVVLLPVAFWLLNYFSRLFSVIFALSFRSCSLSFRRHFCGDLLICSGKGKRGQNFLLGILQCLVPPGRDPRQVHPTQGCSCSAAWNQLPGWNKADADPTSRKPRDAFKHQLEIQKELSFIRKDAR
jgi:hypothetical protein